MSAINLGHVKRGLALGATIVGIAGLSAAQAHAGYSVDVETSAEYASCIYAGTLYKHGDKKTMPDGVYVCSNGTWLWSAPLPR